MNNEFKKRLLSSIILIPLSIFFIIKGSQFLIFFLGILFLASSYEWIEMNKKYSEVWPNISKKRKEDVPTDQDKWRGVKDKIKYLSEKPGKGD